MQALITLGAFLVTLGVLVSFHEYGHFLAARLCGVKVLRFALGFGKPLFTFHARNGTEWVLASIPLGGYVKLLDGRDSQQAIPEKERSESFDVKPLWQRSLIVAAGPFANFLLAVILFSVLYVSGVPQLPARLQTPLEQSVAAKLGVAVGDQVIGWQSLSSDYSGAPILEDFDTVSSWNALRWLLLDALTEGQGFALEIQDISGARHVKSFRQGDLPPVTPESDPFQALGLLPQVSPPSEWKELKLGPIDALGFAGQRVYLISKVSMRLMLGLFTGKTTLKQLGGPLSIADMAGKSVQVGWQPFVSFLALMSISIGLLNLVPLPMLDGGQLLYDAWELVVGKRMSISAQEKLQKVGFLLLISLSLLALFNDLQRYLSP
ncbi:MAG: peptidase [Polynucleobacter sp. 24-46-87]|uniref:M50 family metallopeptidase n=1 Tax=unclassified Polynucleobacter TaxID=2640945 RepID=UPI000BD9EAFD|nr:MULTISPECIES: RIP metalloprotease [unclassified Polynucleobacter]OYY21070.1 MAG: peptidase [Polynucleobacter sp. 35-46-11]OZA15294.1 MAG: peptidase [Polynucleobacter sp. 24-46-87]OZA77391.1 MAG: peptidase [Polynucleobacter sp. 39-46-10]